MRFAMQRKTCYPSKKESRQFLSLRERNQMSHQSNESIAEGRGTRESAARFADNRSQAKQPRYLLVAWILLLLLGALFLFGALSDLLADARMGLPSDHLDA